MYRIYWLQHQVTVHLIWSHSEKSNYRNMNCIINCSRFKWMAQSDHKISSQAFALRNSVFWQRICTQQKYKRNIFFSMLRNLRVQGDLMGLYYVRNRGCYWPNVHFSHLCQIDVNTRFFFAKNWFRYRVINCQDFGHSWFTLPYTP